jgi:hypothetical protein
MTYNIYFAKVLKKRDLMNNIMNPKIKFVLIFDVKNNKNKECQIFKV